MTVAAATIPRVHNPHPPRRHPRLALALALAIASVSAAGCAPTPLTQLPHGVTVDVYQNRIDYSEHKIEVAVANASDSAFTVLALTFSSPAFVPAVTYEKAPTTVRPGTAIDFRLVLPPADCAATDVTPRVHLKFADEGRTGEVTFSPKDRMGQLPKIAAEDCRDAAVTSVASIVPASALRYTSVNGVKAAVLDFTVTPTGKGGTLMIDDVRGTVLVGAWDPATGRIGDTVPLGIDAGHATAPIVFSLTLMPARCDPHVVLEDKRGTFFTFTVTTQRDTGRIFIGVNDDVRIALYDFVGESCHWS